MSRFLFSPFVVVLLLAFAFGCKGTPHPEMHGGSGGSSTHASASSAGGARNSAASTSGAGGADGGSAASTSGTSSAEGGAPETNLFVNALGGSDANPGTEQEPFKTLKKALSVAKSGQTVQLESGTYDASNGESYPEEVPDGVSIAAVTAGQAVLLGLGEYTQPRQVGLQFAGSGSLSYLILEAFDEAISAATGTQTLVGVGFLQDGTALSLGGDAQATLSMCSIAGGAQAFNLSSASQASMTGGEIHDLGPQCRGGVGIGSLDGASSLTLDGVNAYNIDGDLVLGAASSATITNSTLQNVGLGNCGGDDAIWLQDSSSLTLEDTTLSAAQEAILIYGSGVSVSLTGASISAPAYAVDVEGDADITVEGTTFTMVGGTGTTYGVYVSPDYALETNLSLTNATIDSFACGIQMGAGTVKVRNSTIGYCGTGIEFYGGSLDLGSQMDPGGNLLQTNTTAALYVDPTSTTTIDAVGNTWIPKVQGANASGQYTSGTLTGPYGTTAPAPANIVIEQAGSKVVH